MIDWALLGKAIEFYRSRGYRYVETPWIVPAEVAQMTFQGEGFTCQAGSLVGSAEQGFLALPPQSGKLVSCSPCFRPEPVVDETHRLWFMKVELYWEGEHVEEVVDDALMFMSRYVPVRVEYTDDGCDIMSGDLELGSYGERRIGDRHWTYGTGLALPRLSIARE